jgi:hypothetical protein
MIYTEKSVAILFEKSLKDAKECLSKLQIFCGEEPKFTGFTTPNQEENRGFSDIVWNDYES